MSTQVKAQPKVKQARSEDRYPYGLLIFYGPRRKDAVEIAAAIVKSKNAELEPIQTWRLPNLPGAEEIGAFFREHGAKEIFAEHVNLPCGRKKAAA